MEARPKGIIFGRKLIESFNGVVSIRENQVQFATAMFRMRVVDEDTVTFASDWTFNNMRGRSTYKFLANISNVIN